MHFLYTIEHHLTNVAIKNDLNTNWNQLSLPTNTLKKNNLIFYQTHTITKHCYLLAAISIQF